MTTELIAGNVKKAMKAAEAGSRDLWQVPYNQLKIIPGFNVRVKDADYKAHVKTIAESIVANGYYQDKPLAGYVITENGVDVIAVTDGHCRHEAIGLAIEMGAPLDKIPVAVKSGSTSMEDLTVALVTSNSGKPLTPYETAQVVKRLESFGWTPEDMARRLAFSRTYIDMLLALLSAPASIQKMVKEGKVSANLALEAIKEHGEDATKVLSGAVAEAEAKGKTKASKKDVAPSFKTEVKKAGPQLYEALRWVMEDSAYNKLTKATRETIEEIVNSLPEEPQK